MGKLRVEYQIIGVTQKAQLDAEGNPTVTSKVTVKGPVGAEQETESVLQVGDNFKVELDLDRAVTVRDAPEPEPEPSKESPE